MWVGPRNHKGPYKREQESRSEATWQWTQTLSDVHVVRRPEAKEWEQNISRRWKRQGMNSHIELPCKTHFQTFHLINVLSWATKFITLCYSNNRKFTHPTNTVPTKCWNPLGQPVLRALAPREATNKLRATEPQQGLHWLQYSTGHPFEKN